MLKGLIIDEKLGLDQVDEQIRDFLCKKPANFVEEVVGLFQVQRSHQAGTEILHLPVSAPPIRLA